MEPMKEVLSSHKKGVSINKIIGANMVELVYFGEELCERAPGVVGCLYHGTTKSWVSTMEVLETIRLKMAVQIRPASESEMKRAEALAAMYEIGQQIGEKIEQLLDQEGPEAAQEVKDRLAQKIFESDVPTPLLDK